MDKNIFEHFLEGKDDQKYIISVESSYDTNYVHLIVHDPVEGKRIEKHKYRPFLWLKELDYRRFYKGNKNEIRNKMIKHGISFKKLIYEDKDGNIVDRLENGYRYIVHSTQSYSSLLDFFKYGGLSPHDNRDIFLTIGTTEQFLIQTGKRLFKGMEVYEHRHSLPYL